MSPRPITVRNIVKRVGPRLSELGVTEPTVSQTVGKVP